MPKKKLPQTIEEFFVAGLGLAEGLDARNAADVFHGGVIQRLCRGDGALELLVITAEHGRKAESSRRNNDQHGKARAPVLEEQQHQHRQRTGNIGCHLRQKVGKGGFDGVHPLHDVGSRGAATHITEGKQHPQPQYAPVSFSHAV